MHKEKISDIWLGFHKSLYAKRKGTIWLSDFCQLLYFMYICKKENSGKSNVWPGFLSTFILYVSKKGKLWKDV